MQNCKNHKNLFDPLWNRMFGDRHTDTSHTDTQTHRHTNTQTTRHTDTQKNRHTDTQTNRHRDTQTHRLTD